MKRRASLTEAEIHLTPLIDVVFVILILFILVAPLLDKEEIVLAESGLHATSSLSSTDETGKLMIHVQADDSIFINKIALSFDTLPTALSHLKKRYPTAKPQLFYDQRASFGTYQQIKNALEKAGFTELELILSPRK